MKSIFFDTETTGLRPGQIAQLTYIVEEDGQFSAAKNLFFKVEEMEPSAQKVHGFSMDMLEELSYGRCFGDCIDEIKADFEDAIIIAHNVNFDLKFMNAEFDRVGLSLNIRKPFCTMKYFKDIVQIPAKNGVGIKNPKLEEVVEFYQIEKENILTATKKLYQCEEVSYHDARYDTTAMYICCLLSRNRDEVYELLEDEFDDESQEQMSLF